MPKDVVSVPLPRKKRPVHVIVQGARLDGRGPEEFRPLFFSTGVIPQATGSAYAELDKTKLMVGIYGPRPSDRWVGFSEEGRLDCDIKMAPFASGQRTKWGQGWRNLAEPLDPRGATLSFILQTFSHLAACVVNASLQHISADPFMSGLKTQMMLEIQQAYFLACQSPDEREMAGLLNVALEAGVQRSAFPKATVDVQCLILEAGGGELAVAIAAASLAIADAGIPMRDLITSCSVSRVEHQLLLDPTSDEVFQEDGSVMLAMTPSQKQVTQLLVKGEWSGSELNEAIQLCMSGCTDMDAICRQVLQEGIAPAA